MEPIGSSNGFIYYGDRAGWYVAYSQHASNEDTVAESNFRTMARALGIDNIGDPYDGPNGQNADDTAAVESYGGAFGRGQYLLVKPGSPAEAQAREMLERIADYPLLDDDDYSELEYEKAYAEAVDSLRYRMAWRNVPDSAFPAIASTYLSECGNHGYDPRPYLWDDARHRHAWAVALRQWRGSRVAA